MTPDQVFDLLNLIAARDRRTVGKADAIAWGADIGDLDYTDAAEAVSRHFRESSEWLMAAHVRTIVKRIRSERLDGFQYVPVDGDDDPKVYLAARRAQIEAVASGQRAADPAAIEASPEQAAAVRAVCAPAFRRPR